MRNYIILNGQNSNDISGLLIQSLAPISKPLMRTEIEEIDGRDGDITTKLGYSAYDKQITIGLFGNYDVDQVIAFFNSEGTATFSNEPDKYYNYQIYDQIDFERLVRFKTATVTLHCQPFKFATTGESQTLSGGDPISAEGTNLVLEGSAEAPFSQFDLKGNTSQQTYSGKNLYSAQKTQTTTGGITYSIENGVMKINGTRTEASNLGVTFPITYKANTTYTCSVRVVSGSLSFDSKWGSQITFGNVGGSKYVTIYDAYAAASKMATVSFTPTADTTTDLAFWFGYESTWTNKSFNNIVIEIQIEANSSATSFEPYVGGTASPNPDYPQAVQTVTGENTLTISDGQGNEQSYPISLGSIELCKIGTYQDYIYKSDGKWYVHKAVGKAVLDGSEAWYNAGGNAPFGLVIDGALITTSDDEPPLVYCDKFYPVSQNASWSSYSSLISTNTITISTNTIRIRYTDMASLSAFQTWLGSNNTTLYYVLATPVDEEITNAALIEQLNDIAEQAHAYKTRTYVGSTYATGNEPFIIAATVVGDASGTITNAGNIYSKPKLTVYGSGDIGIYLNGVQMFQIALGSDGYITIDTNLMEAYKDNLQTLKNRQVTGDYSNFKLPVGSSTISFSGVVTSCVVENYSRWL